MRSGALLYIALILGLLFVPTVFWAPGLLGILQFLGLAGLNKLVTIVFLIAIATLVFSAIISARGTYLLREHVLDMAPWMLVVFVIVLWRAIP